MKQHGMADLNLDLDHDYAPPHRAGGGGGGVGLMAGGGHLRPDADEDEIGMRASQLEELVKV